MAIDDDDLSPDLGEAGKAEVDGVIRPIGTFRLVGDTEASFTP